MEYITADTIAGFTRPRSEGDIDLTKIVYELILNRLGPDSAKHFMSDPSILAECDSNPLRQRFFINSYFSRGLLAYKARNPDMVLTNVILGITCDGTIDEWLITINHSILIFMYRNQITFGEPNEIPHTK